MQGPLRRHVAVSFATTRSTVRNRAVRVESMNLVGCRRPHSGERRAVCNASTSSNPSAAIPSKSDAMPLGP